MKFRGLQIPLFEASGLQIRWNGGLIMPNNTDIVFRASESITIDNEFTIPIGATVAMIIQGCPDIE